MLTQTQIHFLQAAKSSAVASGHVFPAMAACEAALESGWGLSELATENNNLFGQKQQVHPIYETISLPTKEFLNHAWVTVEAEWIKFPDWASNFKARMATLVRLAPTYPHYANALKARDAEEYILEVSKSWSTGPDRAKQVLAIYNAHQDILA